MKSFYKKINIRTKILFVILLLFIGAGGFLIINQKVKFYGNAIIKVLPTVTPTTEPCGSNSACKDGKVSLYCVDVADMSQYCDVGVATACSHPKSCDIYAPKYICKSLGVPEDSFPILIDLQYLIDYSHINVTVTDPGQAADICKISHEARHNTDGPNCPLCQTEINAWEDTHNCEQFFYDKLCKPDQMIGCDWLKNLIDFAQKAILVNQCICGNTTNGTIFPPDISVCKTCLDKCNAVYHSEGDCSNLANDYCGRYSGINVTPTPPPLAE